VVRNTISVALLRFQAGDWHCQYAIWPTGWLVPSFRRAYGKKRCRPLQKFVLVCRSICT